MNSNGNTVGTVASEVKTVGESRPWWLGWRDGKDVVFILGGLRTGVVCGSLCGGVISGSSGSRSIDDRLARGLFCSQCPVVLASDFAGGVPRAITGHDHPAAVFKRFIDDRGTQSYPCDTCESCGRRFNAAVGVDDITAPGRYDGSSSWEEFEVEVIGHFRECYFGYLDECFDSNYHLLARTAAQADIETNPGPTPDANDRYHTAGDDFALVLSPTVARRSTGVNYSDVVSTLCEALESESHDTDTSDVDGGQVVVSGGVVSLSLLASDRSLPRPLKVSVDWNDDANGHRVMAWLGGAQHQSDVQRAIVLAGIPMELSTVRMQGYVSNSARRRFYNHICSVATTVQAVSVPTVAAAGRSDAAIGNAFKASYHGTFRAHYLDWLGSQLPVNEDSAKDMPVLAQDVERDVGSAARVYCTQCECEVNPVGHELRCRQSSTAEQSLRERAWVGDAVHTSDVRRLLLRCSLPVARLQLVAQALLSAAGQRQYMSVKGYDVTAVDRVVSTQFEAYYTSTYRDEYLVYLQELLNETFDASISDTVINLMSDEYMFDA